MKFGKCHSTAWVLPVACALVAVSTAVEKCCSHGCVVSMAHCRGRDPYAEQPFTNEPGKQRKLKALQGHFDWAAILLRPLRKRIDHAHTHVYKKTQQKECFLIEGLAFWASGYGVRVEGGYGHGSFHRRAPHPESSLNPEPWALNPFRKMYWTSLSLVLLSQSSSSVAAATQRRQETKARECKFAHHLMLAPLLIFYVPCRTHNDASLL